MNKPQLKEIKKILKQKPRKIYLRIEDNPKLNTNEDVIELKNVMGSFENYWSRVHRIKLKENDLIFIWEIDVNDRVVKDGKCYIIKLESIKFEKIGVNYE